jgi:hypothetical protein
MSESEASLAPRIFLSYASEDFNWVQEFKQKFTAQLGGVAVVEDFKDGCNLSFGPLERWLDKRVNEATVIIAFVSRNYYGKAWTVAEWQRGLTRAQRGQVIFVPVMMDADARAWWSRLRTNGELAALSSDYQYSNFASDTGRPANLNEHATIAQMSNLAAELLGMINSAPVRHGGGDSDKTRRRAATPGFGIVSQPEPQEQPADPANDSGVIASASPDIFLLGSPVGRFDVGLEVQVNAASDELQKLALSPKRWGDGWRNDAAKRLPLPSPNERPIFVQPLAAGEVDEPLAYAAKTAERLTTVSVKSAQVALWLPSGQDDQAFEAASNSAAASTFPALRTDTPQGLAIWLRDLVRPWVPADIVVQVEAIGYPEGSEPDVSTTQLADDLRQCFSGIVNNAIHASPGLWEFYQDMITEQIKMLPGNRSIIAVHDLDITPSANFEAIRAALEVKLNLAQGAVEQVNKERAGTRRVEPFFTALLVKHAKALPFANYPLNGRFKDWRLLRFDRAEVKPVPASLAVFRGQLHKWAAGCRAAGVAA